MPSQRILFKLSMPNVGSWNGQWSGGGRSYNLVRRVPDKRIAELEIPNSWYHNFGDGWGASVSARVMECGERRPKSAGFAGYDWMLDRILQWGDTECRHQWEPDPMSGQRGWEGEWERCRCCRNSRRITSAEAAAKEAQQ